MEPDINKISTELVTLSRRIDEPWLVEDRKVSVVLDAIKNGGWKEPTMKVAEFVKNNPEDSGGKQDLKGELLPVINFTGTFSYRNIDKFNGGNGLMIMDYDGFKDEEEMERMKKTLQGWPDVMAVFKSPSYTGLKALVKIPIISKENHEQYRLYYLGFGNKWNSEYLEVDDKCTDISRACYVSYDPDIYINWDSDVFDKPLVEEVAVVSDVQAPKFTYEEDGLEERVKYEKIRGFNFKYQYIPEQKNDFIVSISGLCCEYGISVENAIQWILNDYVVDPVEKKENEVRIRSRYKSKKIIPNSKSFNVEIERVQPDVDNGDPGELSLTQQKIVSKIGFHFEEYHISTTKSNKKVYDIPLTVVAATVGEYWKYMVSYGYFFGRNPDGSTDFYRMVHADQMKLMLRDMGCSASLNDIGNNIFASPSIEKVSPISLFHNILSTTKWDGVSRLDMLVDSMNLSYVEGEEEKMRALFKKWLRLSVAFTFRKVDDTFAKIPKLMNRTVPILYSQERALGKTEFVRTISMYRLFEDFFRQNNVRDVQVSLLTTFEATMPTDAKELAQKQEQSFMALLDDIDQLLLDPKLKGPLRAMISSEGSSNRKMFKEYTVDKVRHCNFIGTTNNPQVLRDRSETRYWIMPIAGKTDWNTLDNLDMIQVWAEVMETAKGFVENKEYDMIKFNDEDNDLVRGLSEEYVFDSPIESTVFEILEAGKGHRSEFHVLKAFVERYIKSSGTDIRISDGELKNALRRYAENSEIKAEGRYRDPRLKGTNREDNKFPRWHFIPSPKAQEFIDDNVGNGMGLPF